MIFNQKITKPLQNIISVQLRRISLPINQVVEQKVQKLASRKKDDHDATIVSESDSLPWAR